MNKNISAEINNTGMSIPLVSVLIPSFNHAEYVREAIESVWKQSYKNAELIVVDDGSSDNSALIINELAKKSPIKMTVLVKENEGLCKTLNKALSLASGQFIALLASDDRILPNHLSMLVSKAIDFGREFGIVYGNTQIINEQGARLGRRTSFPEKMRSGMIFEDLILFRFFMQGSANLYSRNILLEVGGFNENYSGEALDLYLRITKKYPCIYIDADLSEYRVVSKATLNTSVAKNFNQLIEIVSLHVEEFKETRPGFVKKVYALLYKRIGSNFYAIRDLKSSRKWLLKSLRIHPLQFDVYSLLFRGLFGEKILNFFRHSRTKA